MWTHIPVLLWECLGESFEKETMQRIGMETDAMCRWWRSCDWLPMLHNPVPSLAADRMMSTLPHHPLRIGWQSLVVHTTERSWPCTMWLSFPKRTGVVKPSQQTARNNSIHAPSTIVQIPSLPNFIVKFSWVGERDTIVTTLHIARLPTHWQMNIRIQIRLDILIQIHVRELATFQHKLKHQCVKESFYFPPKSQPIEKWKETRSLRPFRYLLDGTNPMSSKLLPPILLQTRKYVQRMKHWALLSYKHFRLEIHNVVRQDEHPIY